MVVFVSSNRNRLSNRRKTNVLQNLKGRLSRTVFEDSERYLFLDYVHCHFDSGLSQALEKPVLDFGCTICTANT